MTQSKHTPGPWSIAVTECFEDDSYFEIIDATGTVICDNYKYYPQAVEEKNARLIAAAPELLEALQAFIKYDEYDHKESDESLMFSYAEAVERARAAIAKATGETP